MNVHATNYLVHFSNVLMLVSYSVRDILWLRWFAVAAALTNIPYFLASSRPSISIRSRASTWNGARWRSPKTSRSSTTWYSAPSGPASSSRSR